MKNFPGTNRPTIPAPTSGYGIFPFTVEAEDGDKRSAANLMAGVENLTEQSNWTANRVVLLNVIEGSDSSGLGFLGSTITTDNPWIYKGTGTFQNGLIVSTGNSMAVHRPATFDANVTFSMPGAFQCDQQSTFTANQFMNAVRTFQAADVPNGSGAVRVLRSAIAMPDSNLTTFDPSIGDIFTIGALTGSRTYTMVNPSAPCAVHVVSYSGTLQAHTAVFKDQLAHPIATFTAVNPIQSAVTLVFDGNLWFAVGPTNDVTVP